MHEIEKMTPEQRQARRLLELEMLVANLEQTVKEMQKELFRLLRAKRTGSSCDRED